MGHSFIRKNANYICEFCGLTDVEIKTADMGMREQDLKYCESVQADLEHKREIRKLPKLENQLALSFDDDAINKQSERSKEI